MNQNPYQAPRPYLDPEPEASLTLTDNPPLQQDILTVLGNTFMMGGTVTTAIGILPYIDNAGLLILTVGAVTLTTGIILRALPQWRNRDVAG